MFAWVAILVLTATIFQTIGNVNVGANDVLKPSKIVCYLHIDRNINFVQLANSTSATIGDIAFDASIRGLVLPVTHTKRRNSKLLGYARGLSFQTSSTTNQSDNINVAPGREQLFETIEYDNGVVNGTISLHGQISFPPTSSDQIAIVGGTRSFLCTQGYGIPSLINSPSSNSIIFRWELHLFYITQCSR